MSPRRFRVPALATAALLAAACAGAPTLKLERPVVLLGEVHDNAQQHALRLAAFRERLQAGARPALLMEQLDRDKQPVLDRLRAAPQPPTADAVIAAAGGPGWEWRFYKPFIELALQHGLPIVAANVARDEARTVMRQGLAAAGFDAAVPPELLQAHAGDIEASHCGMLDAATAGRMALAQVARDQQMARLLAQHAARGAVLLAGNGHVRTDVGAPRWLPPAVRAQSESLGVLETGDDPAPYDRHVFTGRQARPDPCEAMRRPAPARAASGAASAAPARPQ